jgi:23S rRNA pseudouridine2605 synthase
LCKKPQYVPANRTSSRTLETGILLTIPCARTCPYWTSHIERTVRSDPETPTDLTKDRIQIGGKTLRGEKRVYLMLNKPRGTVTSVSDEKGRRTVYEYISTEDFPWVAPVGRLDKASEGLLLFTNDSEWAARITSPEPHLEKTYHVRVGSSPNEELVAALTGGVKTGVGCLRAKRARLLRGVERRSWLEIVLDEGKNRHIRRMFEGLAIDVLRLIRVAIGPVTLGNLPKGAVRPLTPAEKQALDQAIGDQRVSG